MRGSIDRDRVRIAESKMRLVRSSPRHIVREYQARYERLQGRLDQAMRTHISRIVHRVALAQRALNTVSPLATLTRGFAIVTGADGAVLSEAAAARPGEQIRARLARGTLTARVTGQQEE